MDFTYPSYCACHACGNPLHFKSLLSVVVCPCCGIKNYPPVGREATVAAPQPRFPLLTCPACGSQSFRDVAEGVFVCIACDTKVRLRSATQERKFNCTTCHWELPIRGKQRVITCPACGMLNTMPEVPDEAAAEDPLAPLLDILNEL